MSSKAKSKTKVRKWAHLIWSTPNAQVLPTLPKDGDSLEALIREHGELKIMVAWWEYKYADNPLYHTEAVVHIKEWTNPKNGKKHVDEYEDTSVITKFPLASFLAVPDGFIAAAEIRMAKPNWRASIAAFWGKESTASVFGIDS